MAKSPLPVDVHRSKTSLLKLRIIIVAMARRRRPSSLFFRGEVGAAVHNSFSEISHYHQCTECYACSKCHVTLLTLTLSMQLSLHVRESKTVLDSGLNIVDSGFQVPDSSLCQWNLDSGFQLPVGFRTHWAVFRIPKPRISDTQAWFCRIPESQFPYIGRQLAYWRQSSQETLTSKMLDTFSNSLLTS